MLGRALFALTLCSLAPAQTPKPDFARNVQPILARKCLMCHNEKLSQNGVRFDDGDAALAGGYSGAIIVPGKSADSKILERVTSTKPGFRMPPAGPALTPQEVATLKSWIDSGADWPRKAGAAKLAAVKSTHWSFQPVVRPRQPAVKNNAWVRTPVDRFVLERLERENIAPSPEADRLTLLRRASFDLTGLPPTPEQQAEFLADKRADAYERLVDSLLASPHYGEQMARHWLDLARYGDSDGLEKDLVRPYHWRYRSYVIDAFNKDLPFDRFTVEQLAGDLLPNPAQEQLIATGFHRNALTNREGGIDPKEARFEQLVNRTNTTGTVWMGLTVGCAQCHDHKYDPIKQKEYYQLYAFFERSDERDIDAPRPGEMGLWLKARPAYIEERDRLYAMYEVEPMMAEWEARIRKAMDEPGKDAEWDFEVANGRPMFDRYEEIVRTPREQREPRDQERLTLWFIRNPGPSKERDRDCVQCLRDLRRRIAGLDAQTPQLTQAPIMIESPKTPETFLRVRGDYRTLGIKVEPGTMAFLPPLPEGTKPDRLALAQWLVSPGNPLTSRVAVNRLWQEMFGRGLVRTSEDFGKQGEAPTHPELLDWMAAEFVEKGWSVKQMLRTIVLSSTYRQSSHARPDLSAKDPDNSLLARQSRIRLPAEEIRDAALSASGLLNTEIGGPSVRPPQPAGVAELGYAGSVKWEETNGPGRYRRGLYVLFQRTAPYPMLTNFDAPEAVVACSRRRRSNSPLQALNLLNDPVFVEAAQALALRVSRDAPPAQRLDLAFALTVGRKPTDQERERLQRFLDQQTAAYAKDTALAKQLMPLDATLAPWVQVSRVLLNTDEFITRE